MVEPRDAAEGVGLGLLLSALGSAVVELRTAPRGTGVGVRTATLLDSDDLAAAAPGVVAADLWVLAGVRAEVATSAVDRLVGADPSVRPVALVTKDTSDALGTAADAAGIAVGVLHRQARAELVLSTVRSLLEGAAARMDAGPGEPFTEESDLYGLAQRVAALTGGLVSIEDEHSRLLAYSATDGAADELRMLSILGREGPASHLERLRELGVFASLRRSRSVVEVPADERLGWRRRLAVGIQPLGSAPVGDGAGLGTIWLQEGFRPLTPDADSVLEGAAAVAARLIQRARSAPTQEALQIQRLLGIRGGGVDVPSLAAALSLPTGGPAAVVGIAVDDDAGAPERRRPPVAGGGSERAVGDDAGLADVGAALRMLASAYVPESLVVSTGRRSYVLLPRTRPDTLTRWVGGVLDRLTARSGRPLRAAIAAPIAALEDVAAARAEVDRVLDRPAGADRVTTLTRSRTPVLLGEIAELVGGRPELRDPRLDLLVDYDRDRDTELVDSLRQHLRQFGAIRSAAAELHIHPNTLRYRLRRSEQLLGMSLDDPDVRLLLQIQLLAMDRR